MTVALSAANASASQAPVRCSVVTSSVCIRGGKLPQGVVGKLRADGFSTIAIGARGAAVGSSWLARDKCVTGRRPIWIVFGGRTVVRPETCVKLGGTRIDQAASGAAGLIYAR